MNIMNYFAAIRTFVSAADLSSFSAAAKVLNIETSTVSRHVTHLEDDLHVSLFNRSTRGLALTEAGILFYSHATLLLEQWEHARSSTSALNQRPAGLLRISVPCAYGRLHIIPFVDEFLHRHPDISLDIIFNDDIQDLIETHIDLSVRIGTLPDSTMHARKLAPQRRYAWASPEWLAHHAKPLLADCQKEDSPVLMFSRLHGDGWYARKENSGDDWVRVPVNFRFSANDDEAMLLACRDGAGIAILPDWLAWKDEKNQRLQRVMTEWEFSMFHAETAVWIVYPSKKIVSSKVRTFIDFIVEKTGIPPYWCR
ncbi:LysR family transcriptional regulator [Yokenella regensburgei ATCC 49455]|jgi:DNA-binding transcriptional LysR family regulator|nr:LysR substrate binding domain protein [Yokenella regensburgei ATCC 43003]KFD21513.1 LysR family transcriptional regulator [Yokenella regensburgei ATCC 49455]